ncbi:MAG TPA: 16S rRNA (guanine(527)-N(7))-methyltransferase RsmG [Actinomycetota bacterium]|nr:16S rRNA (guanine(527)-N(7))-methyltransferase RsmG [Actinomycetota bacterium]
MFHVKHKGSVWERLSTSQREVLTKFEDLIRASALLRGMVSHSDIDRLHERHVLDSLRAVPWIPPDAVRVCDLGSGAGLPGIPVAVAVPGLEVTLAESRLRRVAFLELAVERLGLTNTLVWAGSARELPRLRFDACLARGFADAAGTWETAHPLLAANGRLLYWAGRSFDPADVPEGARTVGVGEPALESGGPIVIMTRQ